MSIYKFFVCFLPYFVLEINQSKTCNNRAYSNLHLSDMNLNLPQHVNKIKWITISIIRQLNFKISNIFLILLKSNKFYLFFKIIYLRRQYLGICFTF